VNPIAALCQATFNHNGSGTRRINPGVNLIDPTAETTSGAVADLVFVAVFVCCNFHDAFLSSLPLL
jgi:hypothetical protein